MEDKGDQTYINGGLEDENRMAHKLILKNKVKQILVK